MPKSKESVRDAAATGEDKRPGTVLDARQVDYQLALRGLTRREYAKVAGISEPHLVHLLNGTYRPRPKTLRRLVAALVASPTINGAELIVAAPDPQKKTADASTSSAVTRESTRRTDASSTPRT